MPIKTNLSDVRLYADIFNEYLNVSISKPNAALPAPYRQSATGPFTTNFKMSSLRTGASMWTDGGASAASVADSIGPSPTNLGYGTYSLNGSSTDFSLRNSRTILKTTASNLKMSDYRGSFFPYFGNIVHTSYGVNTYVLGAGKFWLKYTLIGGGGGGGGGDGTGPARFGGTGGSGTQASMTCYIASNNSNQAITIYVGEGGGGGHSYPGGGNFWNSRSRPSGGAGYRNGGSGGPPLRLGGSGFGGGGGGASCIIWYPEGTSSTGYILSFAGGGGGGGGAGQFTDNFEAGNFPTGILAGAYGINYSTTSYPRYTKTGGLAGIGTLDTGLNGFLVNRGPTDDINNTLNDGFPGLGADNFYSFYYKNFIQPFGGAFQDIITERFPGQPDSVIDAIFTQFDTGGSGGGGGGLGAPGFLPAFYIYASDVFGDGSFYQKELAFARLEVGGGGGGSGWVYMISNNISNSNFEFAWRNRLSSTLGYPSPRGPINSNSQFVTNAASGRGGSSGATVDGGKGADGAALISITNADHEGGLYTTNTL